MVQLHIQVSFMGGRHGTCMRNRLQPVVSTFIAFSLVLGTMHQQGV